MIMRRDFLGAALAITVGLGASTGAQAQSVTIGYQLIYNPWKVAIAQGQFEEATGYESAG